MTQPADKTKNKNNRNHQNLHPSPRIIVRYVISFGASLIHTTKWDGDNDDDDDDDDDE